MRNLFDELHSGGQIMGGPANFSGKDKQAFANQLDRWLTARTLLEIPANNPTEQARFIMRKRRILAWRAPVLLQAALPLAVPTAEEILKQTNIRR